MSATFREKNTSRPRNRMRATAKAARAAQTVQRTTEPVVRMTLFLNQRKNVPPRKAAEKFPKYSGHGRSYWFSRYWARSLKAVDAMNTIG